MKNKNIITHITKAALATALILISLVAKAAVTTEPSGTCGDGVTYTFNSETGALVISKTGEGTGRMSMNPFYEHDDIKSVIIEEGVTFICSGAFSECTNLTSVKIPNSVTEIALFAFANCRSLTTVIVPSSITSVDSRAFQNVRHIIYNGSLEKAPFGAIAMNGKTEGDFVYEDDTKTKIMVYIGTGGNVIIPNGVTSIGERAFDNSTCITSLTIPECVTTIGVNAFKRVKHIINESNCKDDNHWGANAENGIVDGDFVYEDVTKKNLLAYIGRVSEVTIPDGVTSIGKFAFYDCKSLTSVTIPDDVTFIGVDAFYKCINVENVYLYVNPDNLLWTEDSRDDFITKSKGATKCHVLAEYLGKSTRFTGDVNVTFVGDVTLLTADDITTSHISTTYSCPTPEIEVKCGDKTLIPGTDYEVSYSDNTNVGTAKATIKGIKLYIFTKEVEFTIAPKVTTLGALTLTQDQNGTTATLQGEFTSMETTSLEIDNQIEVSELTFLRTFTAGVPATVMLPFSFAADKVDGKFYTLASVAPINGVWTATMSNPINGIIKANTPYIFKANSNLNKLTFENGDDGVTLQSTKTINDNGSGDWTLHGVYEKTRLDGSNQINYGFAGQATDDGISVGDFIRAGKGVWADPMRCYLTYKKGELTKAATVLPDRIRVVFPDEENSNNETTDIIENTETEDVVTPVSEFVSESVVKVWSFDGTVYIEAQPDMDYTIVDLTGRTIKKGVTHSTHEEINLNAQGIVIVKIGNKSFKLK